MRAQSKIRLPSLEALAHSEFSTVIETVLNQSGYSHLPNIKSKKSEMFWPNVADKYASAVTKDFGLWCNTRQCSAAHFLIMYLSSLRIPNHELL